MKSIKTIENQASVNYNDARWNDLYIKDVNLMISYYSGSITIRDLTNCFLSGKEVTTISLRFKDANNSDIDLINFINKFNQDYRKLFNSLLETYNEKGDKEYHYFDCKDYTITIDSKKAVNVFSPFHLDRVKPLTKTPKKWTKPLAIRALFNNQCENVKLDFHYTDDYRYDQENKNVLNPQLLAKDFMETNHGSVSNYNDHISLRYHSNLYYSFKFKIN